ncbi:hypothetical protein ACPOL_6535 [Acidisarcina polymorpha]|uniref:Uncharacterized protein n=1 Tax=Acidisarcina polymorpha TaxID=2211140 RepID=A0A2Z5GAV7_9BACT|nr:hypothetical protein ACPOL_6535 [Acidisarcina polymorpha]
MLSETLAVDLAEVASHRFCGLDGVSASCFSTLKGVIVMARTVGLAPTIPRQDGGFADR